MFFYKRLFCELKLFFIRLEGFLKKLLLCSSDKHLMITHLFFVISFIVKDIKLILTQTIKSLSNVLNRTKFLFFLRCLTVNLINLIISLSLLSLHSFLSLFLLIHKKSCQSYLILSFCISRKQLDIFLFTDDFLFCFLIGDLWRHFECFIDSV